MNIRVLVCAIAAVLICGVPRSKMASAQQSTLTKFQQGEISEMMHDAYNEVKKHYYDPSLHGLDWDARYQQYSARIATAQDLGAGFRTVAAFLAGLKDSHTYFIPPARSNRYEIGYRYALVGNGCFITRIRPGTDAATKLHVGDQIVQLNGFTVNRQDYEDVAYYFNTLAPQAAVKLDLRSPDGQMRTVVINATVKQGKRQLDFTNGGPDFADLIRQEQNEDHVSREQAAEFGDVMIWKFPEFFFNIDEIERFADKARKHKALILDLRGNGGGATETLNLMIGSLFDHEVKIANRVGRKDNKPMIARPHGKPFEGKLIVLVDARSASAAELLARVVQLEHRGTVIGDQTAGAVMEARGYSESSGGDSRIFYAINVTDANLLMSDGKSLEKTGVTPDELMLPSAADLAAGRDPVLAHAVDVAGAKLEPEAAGKLFPVEWLPL